MKKLVGIIISMMLIIALSVSAFAHIPGGGEFPPEPLSAPITIEAE